MEKNNLSCCLTYYIINTDTTSHVNEFYTFHFFKNFNDFFQNHECEENELVTADI